MNLAENLPYIFIIFIVVLVFFLWRKRNSFLDIEKNKVPVYTENCGGFFGFFSYPLILVRFALYEEFIVISYVRKISFRYDEIDSVEIRKRRRTYGVAIKHKKEGVPHYIWVWPKHGEEIEEIFKSKNVKLT